MIKYLREKHILICFLLIFSGKSLYAQFYETGQAPFSLNWKKVKTDHYTLVFPKEITHEAQRMANILETSYPYTGKSLGHTPRRIPVLMDNLTVRSNGLVVWSPKRMELTTTPAQRSYTQDWLQQLALHEARHVVQVDKLNQGFTRFLRVPVGQIAMGGVTGMLPAWFLEGDAVSAETGLSYAGRGRNPDFQKEWRAILLEDDEKFSYEKAYYGSYRDFIPDHYRLGYQLTAYARKAYGGDIWDQVLDHVGKKPYQAYPFYFGLKKYAGSSKTRLYNQTMQYLDSLWTEQDSLLTPSSFTLISKESEKNTYTNYRNVVMHSLDGYIVEKSGIGQITRFVHLSESGDEKVIHTPGYFSDMVLSAGGNLLVWGETHSNPLWEKVSYNVVKTYNLDTKKETRLTFNSRFFNPYISPDGTVIAVTEADVQNNYFIVLLDPMTGYRLDRIKIPGNEFPQDIRWHPNKNLLVMTLLGKKGKSIQTLDLTTKTWQLQLQPGFVSIERPFFYRDTLLFHGGFSGIQNIYAISPENGSLFQVTQSRFGAYHGNIDPRTNKLIYSNYSASGYQLVKMPIDPNRFVPFEEVITTESPLYKTLAEQENWKLTPDIIDSVEYPVTNYSRALNLINPHSWLPLYIDYDNFDIQNPAIYPGAQIFFQDLLNTSVGSIAGYWRDGQFRLSTTYTYKGFRPVFEYRSELGGVTPVLRPRNLDGPAEPGTFIQHNIRSYFPVNLTRNKYSTMLMPSIEGRYRSYIYYDFFDNDFTRGIWFVNYGIFFYRLLKQSHRDILSRWGQVLQFNYYDSPNDNNNFGTMLQVYGALYFPGLSAHHSLKISANYQKQNYENWLLPISSSRPRGFSSMNSIPSMETGKIDYALPLAYPDFNLGRLLYLKRVRANVFADRSQYNEFVRFHEQLEEVDRKFTSFGMDIISDISVAHFVFPFSLGLRTGYATYSSYDSHPFFRLIFEMDINRF